MTAAVLLEPVPARTGTRLSAVSITTATTRSHSGADSAGASPVVPHGTRPETPPAICRWTRARSADSSIRPSRNGVISAVKQPDSESEMVLLVVCVMTVISPTAHYAGTRDRFGEHECDRLGSDWGNDGQIRRPRHASWRQALGAVSPGIGCEGEIDASAGLEHHGPW